MSDSEYPVTSQGSPSKTANQRLTGLCVRLALAEVGSLPHPLLTLDIEMSELDWSISSVSAIALIRGAIMINDSNDVVRYC